MIAGLAALAPSKRSAEDIFAGRVRVELGGRTYTMPVRSRRTNREWLESLDGWFGATLDRLDTIDDTDELLAVLFGASDKFLDALVSYDATGVLPGREVIDRLATDIDIIRAVMEVWRAANPLVAIALGLAPSDAATPQPTSSLSLPAPTAGLPAPLRTI